MNECKSAWHLKEGGGMFILHDLHPHNTLFFKGSRNHNCAIIHDYTQTGLWNHEWILAFTMHRFVREYVMRRIVKKGANFYEGNMDDRNARRICNDGCGIFMTEYLEGFSSICKSGVTLDRDFDRNRVQYIKCSNLGKLVNSARNVSGLDSDVYQRGEKRVLGELRKFVKFMKEADYFSREFPGV